MKSCLVLYPRDSDRMGLGWDLKAPHLMFTFNEVKSHPSKAGRFLAVSRSYYMSNPGRLHVTEVDQTRETGNLESSQEILMELRPDLGQHPRCWVKEVSPQRKSDRWKSFTISSVTPFNQYICSYFTACDRTQNAQLKVNF